MTKLDQAFWADLAARAGWTALQAVVGVLVTQLAGLDVWWSAPIAMVLSAAKSWLAGRLTGSTSLLRRRS
jgi:hypothetical protein